MVQPSLFVVMTAFLSIAINVQAIPINVDINARDETSENILEARMFKKIASEVGKEAYSRLGNNVLHGGISLSQSGTSNSPGRLRAAFKPSTGQSNTPPTRPSSLIPKIEPMKVPNMAQKPSIGPVSAALKGKNINWDKPQDQSSAVKFDKHKVGLAKEAPAGKPSAKVNIGGKPKAKEAPF